MRCLRTAGAAHRRFRPRLLVAAAAALAAAGLLAALSACTAAKPAAGPPRASWYQLASGIFQPIARPDAGVSVAHRPWTVQSRVADMAFLGDSLYCAVNGSGLATISLDAAGTPAFSYHADSLIFAHRTITTLVPRQGTLAVHLYYNALLNDAPQQDLAIAGICLVSYLPAQSDYSFIIPPFQRKNPDWEAVGFAPVSGSQFDFEWKFTDSSETRFAYTRYHVDTQEEEKETRDAYLAALGVPTISGAGVPRGLAAFFDACRRSMPVPPEGTSLQFVIRSRDGSPRRIYRSVQESDAAVVAAGFEEAGALLALLPGGHVLSAPAGAAAVTIDLPALPPGFRYTDLVKAGDFLVVPWEESSFTDVGRAGIMLFRLDGEQRPPAGSKSS